MSQRMQTVYIGICILFSAVAISALILLGDTMAGNASEATEQGQMVRGDSKKEILDSNLPEENEVSSVSQNATGQIEDQGENNGVKWLSYDESLAENTFVIPLSENSSVKESDVKSDFSKRIVEVRLAAGEDCLEMQKFFVQNPILENLYGGSFSMQQLESGLQLSLVTDNFFEVSAKQTEKDGQKALLVELSRPRNIYDKIVVLDAGHGGDDLGIRSVETYTYSEDAEVDKPENNADQTETIQLTEKDLTLAVAKRVGKLLEAQGIKVYYTRKTDENIPTEQRVQMVNDLRSDMLVSIHADQDPDSSIYGISTSYNNTFFIPEFGNADLSYVMLEKVAKVTNEKALDIQVAKEEDELLWESEVPSTRVNIGYLSNAQETRLLHKEDYLDKLAEGIAEGVVSCYK